MAELNLGGLSDPLEWQSIYIKYGWIDLNAGKDWSAGANYRYLGLTVTPDVVNALIKATPSAIMNNVYTPEGREALVAWQSNWMNQIEPFKTAAIAKGILFPSTVSTGQSQLQPEEGKPFDWMSILLIGGLGLGGYLLYTKYVKKGGGISYGTT